MNRLCFGDNDMMAYPVIAGLLAGTHHPEHPDCQPDLNFKKARPENRGEQGNLNLA